MNEITMEQTKQIIDTICETICSMIERTIYLTGGEISTTEYLIPEINEVTRECFCKICETLEIEDVLKM